MTFKVERILGDRVSIEHDGKISVLGTQGARALASRMNAVGDTDRAREILRTCQAIEQDINPPPPAPSTENNENAAAMQPPHDGDDLDAAEPGEGAADHDTLDDAQDVTEPPAEPPGEGEKKIPDPGPLPVRPLGRGAGVFYFSSQVGEVREFNAKALLSTAGLVDLFDGDTRWLEFNHERRNADGAIIAGEFHANRAGRDLVRRCARLPLWDPDVPLRGRGVWLQGEPGDPDALLIVHCGDKVRLGDRWELPGFRRGGALYRAMPPIPPPDDKIAPPEIGAALVRLLSKWNWEQPNAPVVVAGWIAASMIGAAKPWNPHLLIVAQQGAGKSTLAELLDQVSPIAEYANEFTAPGVRQALAGEARSLILDEAEGNTDPNGPASQTIELIRRLSSAGGLKSLRGAADQRVHRGSATGSAAVLAVLPPELLPQDRSRFTRLELLPLTAQSDQDKVRAAIAEVAKHSLALWGRMLAHRPLYLENLRIIRKALADLNCTPREQDQPGAILAGAATIERDTPLTPEEAAKLVKACAFMIDRAGADDLEGGPHRCLNHLLGSQPEAWASGQRRTVGQVLGLIRTRLENLLVDQLAATGIKVAFVETEATRKGIYIANRHPQLARIFAQTPWAGNKWADDLRRLAGAEPSPAPVRIGGVQSRAIFLPNDLLPEILGDDDRRLAGVETNPRPQAQPPPTQ